MAKYTFKAWNGGNAEAAMAAAKHRHQEATDRLAAAWEAAMPGMQPYRVDAPFRDPATPGYVYLPLEGVAIWEETVDRLYRDRVEAKRAAARGEG